MKNEYNATGSSGDRDTPAVAAREKPIEAIRTTSHIEVRRDRHGRLSVELERRCEDNLPRVATTPEPVERDAIRFESDREALAFCAAIQRATDQ